MQVPACQADKAPCRQDKALCLEDKGLCRENKAVNPADLCGAGPGGMPGLSGAPVISV